MFSRYLMRRGELVYDTDMEAGILQECDDNLREKITTHFGTDIYGMNGLDRKQLARIVFSDKEKLKILNHIVHPAVIEDFRYWVSNNASHKFLFMECAILFEGNFNHLVDKVVVVTAPEAIRIQRVMKRDCVNEESVTARIRNQMPEEEKIKRADWVFDTSNAIFPHKHVDEFLDMLNKLEVN